ncbi:MAG: 3-methyladenine DNA glycosylase [Nocardioidaceae bacterium]|nr:3-methyladenine DNA glycosylase [Nocardioidaceae bacterium]
MEVLEEPTWTARAAAHAARVDPYLQPHLARREARVKHPVHDFLFTYYSYRPAQLRRWHPGVGIALSGAAAVAYLPLKGYAQLDGDAHRVGVTAEFVAQRAGLVGSIRELLVATRDRPAQFGCFGLHEWAMVYHLREDETRHHTYPLRLGTAGTDAVVDSQRIACSHFDAFRFFTPDARPLNALQPGHDDRPAFEQPGCLHAGMDLYKHAFRLSPMVGSDLVADAFELAWGARDLDMRGAPYDVRELGFEPIRIETPEGRQEYAAAQRALAEQAVPLRQRLIEECDRLLEVAADQGVVAALR